MTDLLDLARHVRTQAGVRYYHLPIGALIGKGRARETAKAIVATPHLDEALKGLGKRGTGVSKGTVTDPINCAGNVVLAAKLLSEGKHIRLNREAEVGTLLDRLAYLTTQAAKKGQKAPDIDLCRVSVPKTNLFCAQSKGIPRARMPQLSGVPVPGSRADHLKRVRGDEVDILPEFRKTLEARGVKVVDRDMPADHLKATQDQLIGPKVAGIYEAMKAARANSGLFERIYVTRDGYVIDGHHRWAAQVALETEPNAPVPKMRVTQIDMEIGEALDFANAFANDWGIPQQGFTLTGPAVPPSNTGRTDLSVDQAFVIDLVRHVRTQAGVRKYHLPIGSVIGSGGIEEDAIPKHLLGNPVKGKDAFGNPTTIELGSGPGDFQTYTIEKAIKAVGDAYSWPDMDRDGGVSADKPSIRQQHEAQILAKKWASTDPGDDDRVLAAQNLWSYYQNPDAYPAIQSALRTGVLDPRFSRDEVSSAGDIKKMVDDFFEMGGYTTTEPMTVYHAIKSETRDWAKELVPGTVFSDKGIVSATAHSKFARGWLLNNAHGDPGRTPKAGDVVMELRLPAGQRVMGGDPQFIETMIPPGTRFKILSSTKETGTSVDPIFTDEGASENISYTHVVAEVIPDGE